MSNLPEDQMHETASQPQNYPAESLSANPLAQTAGAHTVLSSTTDTAPVPSETISIDAQQPPTESPQNQFAPQVQPPPPVRIPHFGHLLLLVPLLGIGFVVAVLLSIVGVYFHIFGVTSAQQAGTNIHYLLGTEAVIYLISFGAALLVFPLFWQKSLFAGLQWNMPTALHLRWRLLGAALACFALAIFSEKFMSSPSNAPIEKVFRTPGAGWLLFAFGVTFAPFFEEMLFRGFLLPALCTAYDWIVEKLTAAPRPSLGANGHPQWSIAGMVVASITTSLPFALLHGEQTGYAFGPFLLLVAVSLVLCAVRLLTRSLASSVLVHGCYNLMLFSILMIGTDGFRHLDKI
jgi:uncharacterized protein